MSRVGKSPIELPKGADVQIAANQVTVKGPLGTLSHTLHPLVGLQQKDGVLQVVCNDESAESNALSGTTRALVDYQFKANPTSLEQVFMTVCDVDTKTPGKVFFNEANGNRLALQYDAKAWTIKTELPSFEGMEYESFDKKWGGKKITRVILTRNNTKAKGDHRFSFEVN